MKKLKDYGDLVSTLSLTVLLVINLVTSPDHLWFYWPLFGWELGNISMA
jgi:hypothetical protein